MAEKQYHITAVSNPSMLTQIDKSLVKVLLSEMKSLKKLLLKKLSVLEKIWKINNTIKEKMLRNSQHLFFRGLLGTNCKTTTFPSALTLLGGTLLILYSVK